MNISTSPYFPFFSALEMNAFLHRKYGHTLWQDAAHFAVELRKKILTACRSVAPLLPRIIDGRLWETYSTEEILSAPRFWQYGESENEKNTFPTHGSIRANPSHHEQKRTSVPYHASFPLSSGKKYYP